MMKNHAIDEKLVEEFEKEYGVTKCPDGPVSNVIKYNYGKTVGSKSFSKWAQGKAMTLRNAGYGTARC